MRLKLSSACLKQNKKKREKKEEKQNKQKKQHFRISEGRLLVIPSIKCLKTIFSHNKANHYWRLDFNGRLFGKTVLPKPHNDDTYSKVHEKQNTWYMNWTFMIFLGLIFQHMTNQRCSCWSAIQLEKSFNIIWTKSIMTAFYWKGKMPVQELSN